MKRYMKRFFLGKSAWIFSCPVWGGYKTRISSTAKNRKWLIFLVRNSFLVADSCWAMVRSGNSISAYFTEDTYQKRLEQRNFSNLAVISWFLTFQDKYNICTLSANIKRIVLGAKQDRKVGYRLDCLSVS